MKVKISTSADVSSISADDKIDGSKQQLLEIFKSVGIEEKPRFSVGPSGPKSKQLTGEVEVKYKDVLKFYADAGSITKKFLKKGFTISSWDNLKKGKIKVQVAADSDMGTNGTLSVVMTVQV